MRVAIITESFPPDVNGVAHCVVRVAELLAARGHQPLVIAPKPPRTKRPPHEDHDPGPFPYPHHAVRDAIDVGRERFGNDRDPHAHKVRYEGIVVPQAP